MAPEIRFLTVGDVIAIHEAVLVAGGQSATDLVRPEALESAVHSGRNLLWYSDAGIAEISAHLALHIALAHPWVDGNKRTAATTAIIFARYNGARQPRSEEALNFGRCLVDCVSAASASREEKLQELVSLVCEWFD